MELYQLRCFLAVAEYNNISRAAEAIHMSQSALSKVISRLEKELGTPLFSRTSSSIQLNTNGLLLQKYVSDSLKTLDEGLQLVNRLTKNVIPIRVGYNAPLTMSDILEACQADLPKYQLDIRQMSLSAIKEDLARGALDIGILCTGEALCEPEYLAVAQQQWVAAVTDSHPLHDAKIITPELAAEEIMCFVGPEDDLQFVEERLEAGNIVPKVFTTKADAKSVGRLINLGTAMGIMEEDSFYHRKQSALHHPLKAIPITGNWTRTIYLATGKAAPEGTEELIPLIRTGIQTVRAAIDSFLEPYL